MEEKHGKTLSKGAKTANKCVIVCTKITKQDIIKSEERLKEGFEWLKTAKMESLHGKTPKVDKNFQPFSGVCDPQA